MKALCALVISACFLSGCRVDQQALYRSIIDDGRQRIDVVEQLEGAFGDCMITHNVAHHNFDNHLPKSWTTQVFFGQRYLLFYTKTIRVDLDTKRITETNKAGEFVFLEVANYVGGSESYTNQTKFGPETWKKLSNDRESWRDFDWSIIGVEINTGHIR